MSSFSYGSSQFCGTNSISVYISDPSHIFGFKPDGSPNASNTLYYDWVNSETVNKTFLIFIHGNLFFQNTLISLPLQIDGLVQKNVTPVH